VPLVPLLVLVAATLAGCLGSTPLPSTTAPTTATTPLGSPGAAGTPGADGEATGSPGSSGAASSPAPPSPLPLTSPASTTTPPDSCPTRVLASMTEPQRIGQLFLIGLAGDRLGTAEKAGISGYHFGSVWFTTQSAAGAATLRSVASAVQARATGPATAGVRFLVAANQEGGLIQALSGPGFSTIPAALEQGMLMPAALQVDAARWGLQLRSAGVNLDFAPVAGVVPPGTDGQNAPIGQLQREYGHDPATVRSHVFAFIRGMAQAGVATTVKHFPGLGRVVGNTDFTAGVTDTVTSRHDPYLEPFEGAVTAGVPFVMVSLATYEQIDPTHLAVFSRVVIQDMLRHDLGFGGVVMSDDLGATAAVAALPPATRAVDFLDAGGDLIVSQTVAPAIEMARGLAARAAADSAFRRRVDDAALLVLRAKEALGLLPCGG
jgi:beta-N-acetylhexosaminidase